MTTNMINTNGTVQTLVPIPNDVPLAGRNFYGQGVVLDATANALGVSASNGVACTVGAR